MNKNKDLVTFEFPAEPQSAKLLREFAKYCKAHSEERFWQALRNWSGHQGKLEFVSDDPNVDETWRFDTFYWEKKNG